MRKSRLTRKVAGTLYNLGVASLIASVVWVGVGVYSAAVKKPDIDVSKKDLEPINTTLDVEFLEEISRREQLAKNVDRYLEREISKEESTQPTTSPEPAEEGSPSSEASPAGELEQ